MKHGLIIKVSKCWYWSVNLNLEENVPQVLTIILRQL
jgi:hypothetical protein